MEHESNVELAPSVKPPHVRELTPRSLVAALLVAVVIGAAYPYVVLKLGFGPNISVVSAFFGFLMLGLVSRTYNRWENNIVQTAGTAAGQIAFLSWLLAAFMMLSRDPASGFHVELSTWDVFLWFSCAGMLGALLSVPLRKHFIEDEKLTFADGVAAAETLVLLDSKGAQARRSAFAMLGALGVSAGMKLGTYLKWIADDMIPFALTPFTARMGVGVSLELLSLGSGMIIGVRICASMLVGLVIAWIVAPTMLADAGIITSSAKKVDVLLWVMWPATGMLVAGGMTALALKGKTLIASFRSLSAAGTESRDFPMKWVIVGSLLLATCLVLIQRSLLGTPWWQSALAILLSLPLMLVALRVLGETNWGPISTMTNVMQAMFGAIRPGDIHATVVSSGITGTVAAESEGLMQDYKTGHIVGSTPRLLTYVQLAAIPVGTLAFAWMYPQVIETYGLAGTSPETSIPPADPSAGEGLQSPLSLRWVAFSKVLGQGFASIHPTAVWALGIGAIVGIVLTVLEQNRSLRKFLPSPTGMGIGMLVPAASVFTMFLGSLVEHGWRKWNARSAALYAIPVATGLIAGEALVAVVIPLLHTLGIKI